MEKLVETAKNVFEHGIQHLLSISIWLILFSWLAAFLGAIVYYVWQHDAKDKSFKGFFVFTFPKYLIVHKSTRRDVIFSAINRLTEPLTVTPLLIATSTVSLLTYAGFSNMFGHQIAGPNIWWLSALMIVLILIVQDAVVFLTHYAEHKIPVLWEIHKVHHSLPVMTPISNRRHHPWQLLWEGGCSNIVAGFVLGSVSYIANVPILDNVLLGTDAYFIASTLSCYQLRHSHIPLRYGWLEKWFLSPSQHQLHHSYETKDWDRNFSLLLAVWDRWAGTISYTDPQYTYRIGLPQQYRKDYDATWKFFFIPPYNIAKILLAKLRPVKEIADKSIAGAAITVSTSVSDAVVEVMTSGEQQAH